MRFKIIAIVCACLLLGGGIAYAASPAADVAIQACYNNFTLGLRVSKSGECAPYETPLAWNQAGPPGPAGPEGDTGAQGPKGDQGVPGITSEAFVARGNTVENPAGTVAGRNLPPGSYVLQAKASVTPINPTIRVSGFCMLMSIGITDSSPITLHPNDAGLPQETTVNMLDAVSFTTEPFPVWVHCVASNARLSDIVLIATKVGTLR